MSKELSELEIRIGELFFGGTNPNAIVGSIWPDIKGGDAYQKKAVLVADAIRRYHTLMVAQAGK